MNRSKFEAAKGNCYAVAYALLEYHPAERTLLCHGIVTQTIPPHNKMGHAWLEVRMVDGSMICVDPLFPSQPFTHEEYYRNGKINPKEVVKYTISAALERANQEKNYGPWDKMILVASHGNDAPKSPPDCCDCIYCAQDLDQLYCGHDDSMKVSGGVGRSIEAFRRDTGSCGPEGKLFVIAPEELLRKRNRL